jgi:hypothetical protein
VLEIDIFNPSRQSKRISLTRYFKGFTPSLPQNGAFIAQKADSKAAAW